MRKAHASNFSFHFGFMLSIFRFFFVFIHLVCGCVEYLDVLFFLQHKVTFYWKPKVYTVKPSWTTKWRCKKISVVSFVPCVCVCVGVCVWARMHVWISENFMESMLYLTKALNCYTLQYIALAMACLLFYLAFYRCIHLVHLCLLFLISPLTGLNKPSDFMGYSIRTVDGVLFFVRIAFYFFSRQFFVVVLVFLLSFCAILLGRVKCEMICHRMRMRWTVDVREGGCSG